jgi:phenylalanyl-tRNA synthetase beta chain
MKLSLDWLSDYVTFHETDPHAIARELTAKVAEVEEVTVQGELLENCCVGEVLAIRKHPNADKLSLCDVATDRGTKTVVCGGRTCGKACMSLLRTSARTEEPIGS